MFLAFFGKKISKNFICIIINVLHKSSSNIEKVDSIEWMELHSFGHGQMTFIMIKISVAGYQNKHLLEQLFLIFFSFFNVHLVQFFLKLMY